MVVIIKTPKGTVMPKVTIDAALEDGAGELDRRRQR